MCIKMVLKNDREFIKNDAFIIEPIINSLLKLNL